jgi:hypothetical protein
MHGNNHPAYGQLWQYQGREVFILGNSPSEDGRTIWSAERQTGRRVDAVIGKRSINYALALGCPLSQ